MRRNDDSCFAPLQIRTSRLIYFFEQRRGTNLSRIIIQITLSLSLLVFIITSLLPFLSRNSGTKEEAEIRFDPESRHCDSLKFDCGGGALPGGGESMFTIPRVSSSRIDPQRWRDLDGGRQGNVINFERDFYCGRGGGVRVRLNV